MFSSSNLFYILDLFSFETEVLNLFAYEFKLEPLRGTFNDFPKLSGF